MMFAQAVDLDVLDDYHAAGLLGEARPVDQLLGISAIARCEELECLRYPLRRIEQSFAHRVLADLNQQFAHQTLDSFNIYFHGRYPFATTHLRYCLDGLLSA